MSDDVLEFPTIRAGIEPSMVASLTQVAEALEHGAQASMDFASAAGHGEVQAKKLREEVDKIRAAAVANIAAQNAMAAAMERTDAAASTLATDVHHAQEAVGGYAREQERAASVGERFHQGVTALKSTWTEIASMRSAVTGFASDVMGVYRSVATLAAEQDEISGAMARTGLNFSEAAQGAGRYTSSMAVMHFASRMSSESINLTQQELDQLTRRAALTSQQLGVDVPTAFHMMESAIKSGSARAVRPFGEDMERLSGSTHTQRQRLDELVNSTRDMESATDTAATALARMDGQMHALQRTFATAAASEFVAMENALDTLDGGLGNGAARTREMNDSMQTLGHVVGRVGVGIVEVFRTVGIGINLVLGPLRDELGGLMDAATAAAAHDWSAARSALGRAGRALVMGPWSGGEHANAALRAGEDNLGRLGVLLSGDAQGAAEQTQADAAARQAAAEAAARGRQGTGGNFRRERGGGGAANRANEEWIRDLEQRVREHPGDFYDVAAGGLSAEVTDGVRRHARDPATATMILRRLGDEVQRSQERVSDAVEAERQRQRDEFARAGATKAGNDLEYENRARVQGSFTPDDAFAARQGRRAQADEDSVRVQLDRQAQGTHAASLAARGLASGWDAASTALGGYIALALQGKAATESFGAAMAQATGKSLASVARSFAELEAAKAAASFADLDIPMGIAQTAAAVGLYAAAGTIDGLTGGGSNGSAGAATAASAGPSTRALPTPSRGPGEGSGGTANITINLGGSGGVILGTPAEVGRAIRDVMDRSYLTTNVRMNAGVVGGRG